MKDHSCSGNWRPTEVSKSSLNWSSGDTAVRHRRLSCELKNALATRSSNGASVLIELIMAATIDADFSRLASCPVWKIDAPGIGKIGEDWEREELKLPHSRHCWRQPVSNGAHAQLVEAVRSLDERVALIERETVDGGLEAEGDVAEGGRLQLRFANSGAATYAMTRANRLPVFEYVWIIGHPEEPTQPMLRARTVRGGTCGNGRAGRGAATRSAAARTGAAP
jgi:hypothetical protein